MSRLKDTFARLKKEGRSAFIPFVSAGDPDMETSLAILEALPGCCANAACGLRFWRSAARLMSRSAVPQTLSPLGVEWLW